MSLMTMVSRLLRVALVVAVLLFAACGDDEGALESDGVDGNPVDRAFVEQMVPHHRAAIAMAKSAEQRGKSQFVKRLAEDIIVTQGAELRALQREDEALDNAGVDVGSLDVPHAMMGMDTDPAELRSADPFDPAFLEAMIPHHEGAVSMAKVELERGEDPELRAIARAIVEAQEREVADMRAELARLRP